MKIQLDEASKNIWIYLSGEDQRNAQTEREAAECMRRYRAKGYYPAIFRSGTDDLQENTLALLLHNREEAARKEVRAHKMDEFLQQRGSV